MRNDLTPAFLAEMDKDSNTPITLVVFHFPIRGDVFLSDRDIEIGGVPYKGLVEDFGNKTTVGAENAISSTGQMTLTLWNGEGIPFSNYFLSEDAIDIFVDVYQTYEGLVLEDIAHIDEFVIQDPVEYSEADSLLSLELVTTNMRYFGQVGTLLTRDEYPNALEADLNKSIDLIVGNAGIIKCLCSNKPPTATLSGSFLKLPTTIETHEDLDEKSFTQFGFIKIDEELIRYTSRNSNSIVLSARGQYGTKPTDHSDGAEIIQASDFNGIYPAVVEYIVGKGPLSNISDVRVKGQIPTTSFTLLPNQNPALIRFDSQPTFVEYSKGARLRAEYFDAKNDDNTALMPEWAFDQENKSLGAIIKREDNNTKLSVIQKDKAFDDGQIVGLFLLVEHWETKAYSNDTVDIFVDGVNNGLKIGTLNRPNDKDIIDVGGEIDLHHGHSHQSGVHHSHFSEDPNFISDTGFHEHSLDQINEIVVYPPQAYYGFIAGWSTRVYVDTSPNNSNATGMRVRWKVTNWGSGYSLEVASKSWVRVGGVTIHYGDTGFYEERISFPEHYNGRGFYIYAYNPYGIPLTVKIVETVLYVSDNVTGPTQQEVNINKSIDGSVGALNTSPTVIKDVDDVNELPTGYTSELINILQDNSSRSVVQKFDITDYLESADWAWMKDRKVWLQYSGLNDDVEVIITNISFEIEYRQKQIKTTDEITCDVVGSIESRPDAVVQYLLTEKAGLPENKLGSVYRDVPKWDDDEIWDDTEIWLDEGTVDNVPDGALFEEAGAWFSLRNYSIDGVLSGSSTIKDIIAKITFQTHSKLTWQNGFAKLSVLRKNEDWLIAKDIPTTDIQLKSYQVKKSESFRIINLINLFHSIDRLSEASGSGQFNGTSIATDDLSIKKHGLRTDDDKWFFDLVRKQDMADLVSDFYLWLLGEPQTYYTLNTYLKNFDIEKEEFISISSYKIDRLECLPVSVKEIVRVFGSGKLNRINLLTLVCQSIRHKAHQEEKEENILLTEDIVTSLDFDAEIIEELVLEEVVETGFGKTDEEILSVSENFESEFHYKPKETDEIVIEEAISFDMEIEIEEDISVTDDADGYLEIPFGGGGFGMIPFGSVAVFKEVPTDQLTVVESFTTEIGSIGTDEISTTEEIVTSNGFGGTTVLSSGFGVTPFGN